MGGNEVGAGEVRGGLSKHRLCQHGCGMLYANHRQVSGSDSTFRQICEDGGGGVLRESENSSHPSSVALRTDSQRTGEQERSVRCTAALTLGGAAATAATARGGRRGFHLRGVGSEEGDLVGGFGAR